MEEKYDIENNQKFTSMFIEFEQITKRRKECKNLPQNDLYYYLEDLKRQNIEPYKRENEFIKFCRSLRNYMFHDKTDLIVSTTFLKKFENILNESKMPKDVYSYSTKNIYSKTINSKVRETMIDMRKKNYTHIPIYANNKLVGVFSENSIFQYMIEDEIIEINDKTTFEEIPQVITLDKTTEIIKFVKRTDLYNDVIKKFIDEYEQQQKLSCIMITEHGRTDEKIIGILTTWDIIGK